jgi:hypothetical protein
MNPGLALDLFLAITITIYLLLKFILMPDHIIWIRGKHDYITIAEAPDGDEDYSKTLAAYNDPVIRQILDTNMVPLSFGPTNDGQENRQLHLHKRRYKR